MESLDIAVELERIILLTRLISIEESNSREKQVALDWIGEIAVQLRSDLTSKNGKPPFNGWR